MKKIVFKILTRMILLVLLIFLLMYQSNVDISYLYANF